MGTAPVGQVNGLALAPPVAVAATAGKPPPASKLDGYETIRPRAKLRQPLSIDEVPALELVYANQASRQRTVVICGASSTKPGTAKDEPLAARLATAVVSAGGNVVTGCGSKGTMGAAFYAAAAAAKADGAGENLGIVKEPLYHDEDFANCRVIGRAPSDEARFDLFQRVGATVVIFGGGAGTLLEATKAVHGVAYPHDDMPQFDAILIVADQYSGLEAQLDELVADGTLKPEGRAKIRFIESADALVDEVVSRVSRAIGAHGTA